MRRRLLHLYGRGLERQGGLCRLRDSDPRSLGGRGHARRPVSIIAAVADRRRGRTWKSTGFAFRTRCLVVKTQRNRYLARRVNGFRMPG